MKEFVEGRLKLKRKVLVVDDEEVERRMLAHMLKAKYDVLVAADGQEALDIIKKTHETLSLVLLDLIMPKMDGFEVLHEMMKNDKLKTIPVIMLTSEKSAEVKSLKMGAADFVPKPYEMPEVILARIGRTIQLYESNRIISATKTDPLTGLFQRDYFMNYVEIADNYAPDIQRDIIVLNINRFHIINEIHGRDYGDLVLSEVGVCVKNYVERNRGVACRNNGDMFYLYVPHQENPEELLWQVHVQLEDTIEDAQTRIRMGIYSNVDKSLEIEKRFDCALLACNSVKGNYKASIAYYDKAMHEKEAYEERLIMEMDKALSEGQFVVYYQPKYAIQGTKTVLSSAEALVRWKHPELGMINPERFISVFENNGMIHSLDHYIWWKVAGQIAEWKKKFGVTVPVSVNVSRIDLLESNFVEDICEIVKEAEIFPTEYLLEITESAYTEDSAGILAKVNELRGMGFHIEMDDFGTGYSSLNMISSLPIDVIKLDIGFVRHIHENDRDYKMVEIVMEIAKLLGVKVVAEGVELEAQHELLKKAGVDIIQGYYYSRPVPPDEFEKFIVNNI
ncbi:MAG: EAL domain-containing protein [Pseudobutyrivibrio sp.]|nr:EAL domain-containing protein [Pseudobutyrivibrio sp.]